MTGFRSRAWVMARSEWIRANLTGLQRLLEPLAERLLAGKRSSRAEFKRKAMGAQAGALFGYVAQTGARPVRRLPPARRRGTALLRRSQRRRGGTAVLAPRAGLPVVDRDPRGHAPRAVRLGAVAARSSAGPRRPVPPGDLARLQELVDQIKRAVDEARGGVDARMGGIFLLLTPRAARAVRADARADVPARGARVLRHERGGARSRGRRRPDAPGARRPASWIEHGAGHPEGDRVRAEDPAVRGWRTVRPRGDRERGHGRPSTRCGSRPTNLPTLDEVGEPARWIERISS